MSRLEVGRRSSRLLANSESGMSLSKCQTIAFSCMAWAKQVFIERYGDRRMQMRSSTCGYFETYMLKYGFIFTYMLRGV